MEGDLVQGAGCGAERLSEKLMLLHAQRSWTFMQTHRHGAQRAALHTGGQPGRAGVLVLGRLALLAVHTLRPELLDELQGEGAAGSLIPAKDWQPHDHWHDRNKEWRQRAPQPAQSGQSRDEPIDGRSHEHQIWPQQFLHQRKRDGSSLVNHQQLCLAELHSVTRVDVLRGQFRGRKSDCENISSATNEMFLYSSNT